MKATLFNKPLEWSIETQGESWQQGSAIKGILKVKNHGQEELPLENAGVGIAHADVKKVHARTEGILKPAVNEKLSATTIKGGSAQNSLYE